MVKTVGIGKQDFEDIITNILIPADSHRKRPDRNGSIMALFWA